MEEIPPTNLESSFRLAAVPLGFASGPADTSNNPYKRAPKGDRRDEDVEAYLEDRRRYLEWAQRWVSMDNEDRTLR